MANKKRLIDADALKKAMCYKCNDEYSDEPCEPSDCVFCNAINDAPTVEAVEVVHCKDCKFWDKETGFCDNHSRFYHGGMDWDMFSDEDFCSYGEVKTDG